jgi:predicted nucleic acid-binding protein
MKAIADTGFLIAFVSPRDSHHKWAARLAEKITEPLLTCDAVLVEAAFHIGSAKKVLELVEDGLITPVLTVREHLKRLTELATTYADRQPDLADLCLIRLSELYPKYPVITTDIAGFRVYRRGRREIIPLLTPSALR